MKNLLELKDYRIIEFRFIKLNQSRIQLLLDSIRIIYNTSKIFL